MSNDGRDDEKARQKRHKLLWVLLALFIFCSIAGMMLADQYFQAKIGANTAAQGVGE